MHASLSIGSKLDDTKGIGPGFDFLRIFLAVSVLATHSVLITQGNIHFFEAKPFTLLYWVVLPLFFALSGFLITGSAMRLRLKDFLLNRGMRIVPALAVDICIAALIIGPIFTTLPLRQYFTRYEFYAYFANITGIIHYVLPGVFESNPFPATVNGSLWTVPFEIGCYIIMSVLILSGVLNRKGVALAVTAATTAYIALTYSPQFHSLDLFDDRLHTLLDHFFAERGNFLYSYFMTGSMFYLFRYHIPYHRGWLLLCVVIFMATAYGVFDFMPPLTQKLCLMPIVIYITVYVGLVKVPPLPIYHRGDYSYGVYLYGYPIQQAIVTLAPSVTSPLLHFAMCLPLVTLVAMFSWHCIEKPILRLRKKFSFTARKGDDKQSLPTSLEIQVTTNPNVKT
jgi:peptidoglycan/LPS O-acetylase OafA/YrhL